MHIQCCVVRHFLIYLFKHLCCIGNCRLWDLHKDQWSLCSYQVDTAYHWILQLQLFEWLANTVFQSQSDRYNLKYWKELAVFKVIKMFFHVLVLNSFAFIMNAQADSVENNIWVGNLKGTIEGLRRLILIWNGYRNMESSFGRSKGLNYINCPFYLKPLS